MGMFRVVIAIFVVCGWGVSSGWAVSPSRAPHHYVYDGWQIDTGLPQNFVKKVTQTPDGYLWLATQEGLVRYDGLQFRTYNQFNTPTMLEPEINDLLVGVKGELWVASRSGLLKLEGGKFTRFAKLAGFPGREVTALAAGKEGGALWVGTREGVFLFKGEEAVRVGLEKLDVRVLMVPLEGGPVVGTDKGLFQLDGGKWVALLQGEAQIGRGVSALLAGSEDHWVGTQGRGVYRYVNGRWEGMFKEGPLAQARIQGLYEDTSGALWISTFSKGLVRYFQGHMVRITTEDGLAGDAIECAFEDREGSLWVGTGSSGLNRLRDGRFTTITRKDGLLDEMVWAVFEGSDGAMWVGTEKGVTRYKDGRPSNYSTATGLSDNIINAFAEDIHGRVWVGTYNGVSVIDPTGVRVLGEAEGIPGYDVRSLAADSTGGMWLGVMGGGVLHWTQGEKTLLSESTGLISNEVRAVVSDGVGGLWVGTNHGLSRVGPNGIENFGEEQGFIDSRVFAVNVVSERELWLGTDRGLFHFADGVFTGISVREGLFDDKVYTILPDGLGFLWMSSNRGVFRIAVDEGLDFVRGKKSRISSTVFGAMEGMRSVECNAAGSNAGWRGRDGYLWFATIAGAATIDPAGENLSVPPQVVLEKLVVDGVERRFEEGWGSDPGVESIRIHYAAPTFVVPEEVRFKYRLLGLSDDWVYTDTLRVAQYAHLSPGDYTFEVKAISRDGFESIEAGKFSFYLTPFFYQTRLFLGGCGILFLCSLWGAHRFRVLQHEKKERYLEGVVRARTEELHVVNQQLLELSTRDPLTGLRNRRYLLDYMEGEIDYANRQHYRARAGSRGERNRDVLFFLIDLDHFKVVNDTYGHAAGDRVLVQAGALLTQVCRKYDRVVRWGGEEFLLVAPKFNRESVHVLAHRILSVFRDHRFDIGVGEGIEVTCSIGVAGYPFMRGEERLEWEDVVAIADEALYLAKKNGRNRWVSLLETTLEEPRDFLLRFRSNVRDLVEVGEVLVGGVGENGEEIDWEELEF